MPILTRRVRAAMAVAMTSGEDRTERPFWKWISASHTASKPSSSAAVTWASDSSKAWASSIPGGLWNSVKSPTSMLSPETRHDFAGEELHRSPDPILRQAAEIHPAQHLSDAHVAHRLDMLGDRVGRSEGHRLRNEPFPGDLGEALGRGAEARLEARVRVLDALGHLEATQRILVPHLGVLGFGQRLPIGIRHVDLPRHAPVLQERGDLALRAAVLAQGLHVAVATLHELVGRASWDGVQHGPAARGRALDAVVAAADLIDHRMRPLHRLWE